MFGSILGRNVHYLHLHIYINTLKHVFVLFACKYLHQDFETCLSVREQRKSDYSEMHDLCTSAQNHFTLIW